MSDNESKKGDRKIYVSSALRARAVPETIQIGAASTGTPQILMSFEVCPGQKARLDGTDGEREDVPEGWKMSWISFLSENTRERTVEALQNAGWTGSSFRGLVEALARNDSQGIGSCEVSLSVGARVSQDGAGRFQEVKFVNSLGGGGLRIPKERVYDAKALADLDAQCFGGGKPAARTAGNGVGSGGSRTGNAGARALVAPADDADIPF